MTSKAAARRLPVLMIGLLLSGCSGHGAEGQPVPPPGALDVLQRPSSPNTALAAPSGFKPTPDILTPRYGVPPQALYSAIRQIAAEMPRTYPLSNKDDRLEAAYVARSRVFNFPDTIMLKVAAVPGGSTLVLYSASRYGESDFGVNKARVTAWLAALDTILVR